MTAAFGIDEIRAAVRLFSNCNETFNQSFAAYELVKLYRAYASSGWDIRPESWDERQIQEALLEGKAPQWAEDSSGLAPVYSDQISMAVFQACKDRGVEP